MKSALAYLTFATLGNALRERLRRLRQPKYLVAALVGAAYFYFFVFGFAWRGRRTGAAFPGLADVDAGAFLELAGAFVLFLFVVFGWIFGRERAAVNFTEAETMFLFPAPFPRHTLLNYKLLRSQLPILLGAVLLAFVFRRGAPVGAATLRHALGWWLVLATLNLHFIASSFTRERLLAAGVTRLRRILLIAAGLAAAAAGWWLVARQTAAAQQLAFGGSWTEYTRWFAELLAAPPLGWILAPFRLLVRPYLAADGPAFLLALGPAALLLALHYWWVVRTAVAFEEAAIENAAKAAQLLAAMRKGGMAATRLPTKARPEPFALRAAGWEPPAFLWKTLVGLGPFYRLRTWFIAAGLAAAVITWLRARPEHHPFLAVAIAISAMCSVWLLILGPLFLRRHTGVILDQLEMTKSYPLPGWKIILGELLPSAVLVTFAEWLLLFVFLLSASAMPNLGKLGPLFAGGVGAAAGILLLVPPLVVLLMGLPLASMLYFPAWTRTAGNPTGGVEAVGQGLILVVAYLLVTVATLFPAAGAGAIAFIIVNWLAGKAAALTVTLLVAGAILAAEAAAVIWWLGGKLEQFDLSQEMAR